MSSPLQPISPSSGVQTAEVQNHIRSIILNPQVRQAALSNVIGPRPKGWSKRSRCPYYNAFYASKMKNVADEMMKTKQSCIFSYKDYPGMSRTTLYMCIDQGFRYLREQMDTDEGTYNKFCTSTRRTRPAEGVMLSFRPDAVDMLGENDTFTPRFIQPLSDRNKWKEQIEEYISRSGAQREPLLIEGLLLSPKEIADMKEEFVGTEEILITDVTASTIKIIKVG